MLSNIVDIIILLGAVFVAITNIYKFLSGSRKGIQNHVEQVREENERELQEKIEAKTREVVTPMLEQHSKTLVASFEGLLDKYLPSRLLTHDLETREKYLADRQRYLCEIKDEVVNAMRDKIEAVDNHGDQMLVFTEVLKELLRERIMEIYRRNKHIRQLEEHERFELNQAYASYKSINGNSYIDGYYATMCEWATVPDNK